MKDVSSPRVPTSSRDDREVMFSRCFRDNPFELAGLADLPEEDEILRSSLTRLRNRIESRTILSTEELAEVMYVLLRVAQSDYRGSFWPQLEERLGLGLSPQDQGKLGKWFRSGLRRFNYQVPKRKKSQRNLTPILVHAGAPRGSLEGLVSFIAVQLDRHGSWLADPAESAPDLIRQIVREYKGPRLHRNVKRILLKNWRGAVELWSSLARAILAPTDSPDFEEAIQLLPPGVDPGAVREAIQRTTRIQVGRQTQCPPRLQYDPEMGSVRLWLPRGAPEDWDLRAEECRFVWDEVPEGATAEFLGPLPQEISIAPRHTNLGMGRAFSTQPGRWPGLWFRASTGNLEQGTSIDRNGLEPGRWFVLFEGTPDEPGNAEPRWLNWNNFGAEEWTAWEVEVPARSDKQREFVWTVGQNEFTVPLARRPGSPVRISDPVARASSGEGNRLPVYGESPVVTNLRDCPCVVRLWRRMGERWEPGREIELLPDQPTRLPVDGVGIYRLREARGKGGVLAELALVPGLCVNELQVSGGVACLRIEADSLAGEIAKSDVCELAEVVRQGEGSWEVSIPTVEPQLAVAWRWADLNAPDLLLRWPIPGFRWRVIGLDGERPRWTRDVIFLEEARVAREAPELEVHLPGGADLKINGEPVTLTPGPAGCVVTRSLNAYRGQVLLTYDNNEYGAVVITSRPVVDRFVLDCDEQTIVVSWSPTLSTGTVLLAWDPLSPSERPRVIPLSADELREPGEWIGTWDVLPGSDYVAVALGRAHSSSGFNLAASYVVAVKRQDPRKSTALLFSRSPAEANRGVHLASRLALDIQLDLLSPKFQADIGVAERIEHIRLGGEFPLGAVLTFARDLDGSPLLRSARKDRIRAYVDEIRRCLNSCTMFENWVACAYPEECDDDFPGVGWLLRNGIHPGWTPVEDLPESAALLDSLSIPLKYYRDLWLVSRCYRNFQTAGQIHNKTVFPSPSRDDLVRAAKRLWNFHKNWDLPSPQLFLPWRANVVRVAHPDLQCGRQMRFVRPMVSGEDRFLEELGLSVLMIRGSDPSRNESFRLRWEPDSRYGWAVEPRSHRRVGQGWRTGGQPLVVPASGGFRVAEHLAEQIALGELLPRWTSKKDVPSEVRDFLSAGTIDRFLKSDPPSGPLHRLVVDPPRLVKKRLLGEEVKVPDRPPVPELAQAAWRVAWVDRLAATLGPVRVFGPAGMLSVDRLSHMNALAMMIEYDEALMIRMLALAELLIRMLYDGGIGFAGRYETCNP